MTAPIQCRSASILVHHANRRAWDLGKEVALWLEERGIQVVLDAETAARLELPQNRSAQECVPDIVVSLGGDGTLLRAARSAGPRGVPILGVHMGRFGFIAETHPSDIFTHLKRALEGHVTIEERLMIRAEIRRRGEPVFAGIGLNDAVVKSSAASLVDLDISIRGSQFASYPADGVIVATPTGSTAYSLSAGGPVVEPTVQALIITPICPHTLSARPMVVPSEHIIEIRIAGDHGDVIFKVDGVDPFPIERDDRVVVRKAEQTTRLVVVDHASFYRRVRARYGYGERRTSGGEPE